MADLESIPCPNCTPESVLEQHEDPHRPEVPGFWRTYPSENKKECYNCGHEEPYYPKSSRNGKKHGSTKSQDEKMRLVRQYAESHCHEEYEIETEHLEWGPMSVKLHMDPDEALIGEDYHAFISRRGKVKLVGCFPPLGGGAEDACASMFCRATNGHDERRQ